MRPETLQRRLCQQCCVAPGEVPMWSKKKSDTTQTADPGTEKLGNESAAKTRSAVLGRNNQDEQRRDGSGRSDRGPRPVAARIETTFERRNLGQRGPRHRRNS